MKPGLRRLTSESIVYGLGQAAGRAVQFFLVPILTRVFTPAEYGVVDLLTLVTAIVALLVVMGTDAALARFYYEAVDGEERRRMVSTSALWRAGLCLLLAAVLAVTAPWFSKLILGSPDYAKYVRISALTLPFTAFFLFQNDVLRVTFQPVKYVALNLTNTVLVGGLSILFVVVLEKSVSGVLYAKLVGDAITAGLGLVLIRHYLTPRFQPVFLKRMLAYGAPLIPVAVAYWAINYADRWVLARFADLSAVGIYAVSVKLGAAMMLAVSAFQLAWGPFAFARAREPDAPALFSRVLTLYVGAAAWIALAIGLFAPEILAALVPPAYWSADVPGALLAFAAVAHGAYYIAALGVNLALRNEVLAWTSFGAALVTVVLDLLLVRPFGLVGVAAATLTGFCLSTILLYVCAQRIHPIPHRGTRALVLFAAALVTWAAGGTAGLGLRVILLAGYGALAAWLARRLPPPTAAPVTLPGDAAMPPDLPGEVA